MKILLEHPLDSQGITNNMSRRAPVLRTTTARFVILLIATFELRESHSKQDRYRNRGVRGASAYRKLIPKKKGRDKNRGSLPESDFVLACQVEMVAKAADGALTDTDYADFLSNYCHTSPFRGPACGDGQMIFSNFPFDLQLVFATSVCPTKNMTAKIECVQDLANTNPIQFAYSEEVEELCEQTFVGMVSTGMLMPPTPSANPAPDLMTRPPAPSPLPSISLTKTLTPTSSNLPEEEASQEYDGGNNPSIPNPLPVPEAQQANSSTSSLVVPLTLTIAAIAFVLSLFVSFFIYMNKKDKLLRKPDIDPYLREEPSIESHEAGSLSSHVENDSTSSSSNSFIKWITTKVRGNAKERQLYMEDRVRDEVEIVFSESGPDNELIGNEEELGDPDNVNEHGCVAGSGQVGATRRQIRRTTGSQFYSVFDLPFEPRDKGIHRVRSPTLLDEPKNDWLEHVSTPVSDLTVSDGQLSTSQEEHEPGNGNPKKSESFCERIDVSSDRDSDALENALSRDSKKSSSSPNVKVLAARFSGHRLRPRDEQAPPQKRRMQYRDHVLQRGGLKDDSPPVSDKSLKDSSQESSNVSSSHSQPPPWQGETILDAALFESLHEPGQESLEILWNDPPEELASSAVQTSSNSGDDGGSGTNARRPRSAPSLYEDERSPSVPPRPTTAIATGTSIFRHDTSNDKNAGGRLGTGSLRYS